MVEGEELDMSEPTNAPRVWLRWALALALATGTVAGSVLPVLAQDEATGTEAPAEQSTVEEAAPVAEEQAPAEPVEAPAEEPVAAAEPVAEEPVAAEPVPDLLGALLVVEFVPGLLWDLDFLILLQYRRPVVGSLGWKEHF